MRVPTRAEDWDPAIRQAWVSGGEPRAHVGMWHRKGRDADQVQGEGQETVGHRGSSEKLGGTPWNQPSRRLAYRALSSHSLLLQGRPMGSWLPTTTALWPPSEVLRGPRKPPGRREETPVPKLRSCLVLEPIAAPNRGLGHHGDVARQQWLRCRPRLRRPTWRLRWGSLQEWPALFLIFLFFAL